MKELLRGGYNFSEVDVDDLPNNWKQVRSGWGHSLHLMCSRIASFPPALAHYFIKSYSDPGDIVLDPFSGKGTVPLETLIANRKGIGNDISPDAYVLTHAKLKAPPLNEFFDYLDQIKKKIKIRKHSNVSEEVKIFYHRDTLRQILGIRELIQLSRTNIDMFLKGLMLGILHGPSALFLSLPCSHYFSMAPKYVKRYAAEHHLKRPRRDVIKCLEQKAKEVLKDPLPQQEGKVFRRDSCELPLEKESINLIVTSPPYFSVHTYAWDNWLRLWFLGYDYRKVRKKLIQTESQEVYVRYMMGSLKEMFRVLKPDSACFVVVGDVTKNGKTINTAALLGKVAESIGFDVNRIILDNHRRKFKVNINKKQHTDRILFLTKGTVKARVNPISWDWGAKERLFNKESSP